MFCTYDHKNTIFVSLYEKFFKKFLKNYQNQSQ